MSNQADAVPYLSLDYGEVNPNHKLRFLALLPPKNYWITNVAFRFRRGEQSIYLAPQLTRSFTIEGLDIHKTRFSFASLPDEDFHVSLHETGIINLTVGKHDARLRSMYERSTFEVITLGIKDPRNL